MVLIQFLALYPLQAAEAEALKRVPRLEVLVNLVEVAEAQVILVVFHPLLDRALPGKVTLVDCHHKFLVVKKRKVAVVAPVLLDCHLWLLLLAATAAQGLPLQLQEQ
jgi:hypothetical protein